MKRLSRIAGLVGVCLIALAVTNECLIAPATGGSPSSTSGPVVKTYYLSSSTYTGTEALTACVPGFHMASLFELSSLGALKYLSTASFAFTAYADQGQGPP